MIKQEYTDFLESKIVVAESFGFEPQGAHDMLFPHQKDITQWALRGGRRAIFAAFGLGKTFMQLELARQVIAHTGKPFLIVCPLGVVGEFRRDNDKLQTGLEITYITNTTDITHGGVYVTNYERVRGGGIDPDSFGGVSFDEASILRNLSTETTSYVLENFRKIPYRFVATATPTPNDFIEILNYADYLGVIDRGHALTRFFVRNSTTAGDLQLLENKKKEFWMWVSSWAAFISKPSDLGYDDTGYDLPPLNIIEHRIEYTTGKVIQDKTGQTLLVKKASRSLSETGREKRESMPHRIAKTLEIINDQPDKPMILWHHREAERAMLEGEMKTADYRSVFGSQKNELKEKNIIDFSNSDFQYLITKPQIAGSGCNFQEACADCIFVGIDYKFNDFIQAVHRIYRFMQTKQVNVHIIYTHNEDAVFDTLMRKWGQHKELQAEMIALVRKYGLNNDVISSEMKRQIFATPETVTIGNATVYNGDTVDYTASLPDDSIDLTVTSIPFGNHYEYSDNYNDFGHNRDNARFFEQMDYMTPELFRATKPGRIACIHVKDRIRYSYQNGTSFTTIEDFTADTSHHYRKHGFHLIGKITITTDVVAENNQTYRLTHAEKCKDGTKMGVGLPEYVLIFRKPPTENNNAYADEPVRRLKEDYTLPKWQVNAHAYYRSDGDRFVTLKDIEELKPKQLRRLWKDLGENGKYNYEKHVKLGELLLQRKKLSKKFTTLETHSNHPNVWTDVNRMNTLNAKQVNKKKEKHICPLQFDIIERLIERYSLPGELIYDPFGGLFSTAYKAVKMNRKAISSELNSEYFQDGCAYLKAAEYEMNVPTLFDLV